MIQQKAYTDLNNFYSDNGDFLHRNFILTYTFQKMLDKVQQGEISIYELYAFTNDSGGRIIGMKVDEHYLLTGESWDEELMDKLVEKVELLKYKRWQFAGERELILALFEKSGSEYLVIKDRVCYRCDSLNDIQLTSGQLEMAVMDDLETLADISWSYSKAEYGKKHARAREYMRELIYGGILAGNFFVWRDQGRICAVAQVIYNDGEPPIIGHLYTVNAVRNKGYATAILASITKNLLDIGHPGCCLLADSSNPASLKVFEKVDYQVVGKTMLVSREL